MALIWIRVKEYLDMVSTKKKKKVHNSGLGPIPKDKRLQISIS